MVSFTDHDRQTNDYGILHVPSSDDAGVCYNLWTTACHAQHGSNVHDLTIDTTRLPVSCYSTRTSMQQATNHNPELLTLQESVPDVHSRQMTNAQWRCIERDQRLKLLTEIHDILSFSI
jgi:hypothetical protein